MSQGHLALVLTILFWVVVPVVGFIARHWIVATISKSVQHHFDRKLEEVRADLRKTEERFKSDLRDREAEIAGLRNAVLSGSAGRQALLDKRRFEAVEKVWTAVNNLAVLKPLSATMALLNFKAVAEEVNDPRMQTFLSVIGASAPDPQKLQNLARDEQPYLSELAWAYFSAYTTILYGSHLRYLILKAGVEKADKFLTNEGAKKILKAALPHQTQFIDENEPGTYHYLLEEIEACLLAELRRILEGREADQAATMRAKDIMNAIREVDKERAQQEAAAALPMTQP